MSLWSRIPLSPMGWAALAVLVTSIALIVLWLRGTSPFACSLDERLNLPSGRSATLCEVVPEAQPFSSAVWLVVRVVVPGLPDAGEASDHADHDWICETVGLPRADVGTPERIVVQLMQTPFPRGEAAPEIRQSIEAYSLRDGSCIWELL